MQIPWFAVGVAMSLIGFLASVMGAVLYLGSGGTTVPSGAVGAKTSSTFDRMRYGDRITLLGALLVLVGIAIAWRFEVYPRI